MGIQTICIAPLCTLLSAGTLPCAGLTVAWESVASNHVTGPFQTIHVAYVITVTCVVAESRSGLRLQAQPS